MSDAPHSAPAGRPPPDAPAGPPPALPELDPRGPRLLEQLEEAERLLPEALRIREESVHKLRVALRRARVLARELERRGGPDEGRLVEVRRAPASLFRALAGLRDLDILEREWKALLQRGLLPPPPAGEIAEWIRLERSRLRSGLPAVAADFVHSVSRFRDLGGPAPRFGTAGSRAGHGLRRRSRRFLRQLERARSDPADPVLHRLRIRGKQLRYAAEAAGEAAPAARLERRLKTLQDALGAIQDAATVTARLEALGAGGSLPPRVALPARAAAAQERDRRRRAFLDDLEGGAYADLLREVSELAGKQGNGGTGEEPSAGREEAGGARLPLEKIPGIGAAKARRLAEAGLATPEAIRSASLEDLSAVKTIGPHQAKLIKAFVEDAASPNGPGRAGDEEPDGKRFERTQSVLAVGAAVADYARTLAEEFSRHDEGDAIRAARQAERLSDGLEDLEPRLRAIPTKRLKGLRGELREAEGLLAKVLELDAASLKMNKLRKALKAHRKAIETYLA